MKGFYFYGLFTIFLITGISPLSYAIETSSLNDKYDVYLLCTEDAGDYCNADEITKDEFSFDDGEFTTQWFDEQLWGFNEPGEYEDNGGSFSGSYEVYNESAEKYEIEFQGISLVRGIILGTMNIKYYEWNFLKFNFDKKDDATAYFLGVGN
jgi:hypothetical protein